MGVGVGAITLTVPVVVVSVLALALVGAMWWTYFDVSSVSAERRFAAITGVDQTRMARDAYSFIHLPMVAGIVLAALGMKKVLGYVAGEGGHDWTDALHGIAPIALHGGVALYLLAHVCFRLRNVGTLNRQRLFVAVLLLALVPVGERIGALMDLLLVSGIAVALIAYEALRHGDIRDRVRRRLRGGSWRGAAG